MIWWERSLVTSNWSGSSKVSTKPVPWRAATTSVGEPGSPSPLGPVGTTSEPGDPCEQRVLHVLEPGEGPAAEADHPEDGREKVAVRVDPGEVGREAHIGQIEAGNLLLDGSVYLVREGNIPAVLAELGAKRPHPQPEYRGKAAETGLRVGHEVVVRDDVDARGGGREHVPVAVVDRSAQGGQRDTLVDLIGPVGRVVHGVDTLDLDEPGRQA